MAGEPTLQELIAAAIDSRLLDLHTGLPGIVDSYNPATQTASVKLAVRRPIEGTDGTEFEEIPIIPNVPVGWFSSGGFAVQFPISPGDGVWLMFSEAAWAHFRTTGEVGDPGDFQRHSLSYAVALPIVRPNPKALTAIGANEGVIDVPSGNTLRVGGPSAQLVALSNKVQAQFQSLKSAINGWTPVANDGGAALKTALSSFIGSSSDVAATKLKAE